MYLNLTLNQKNTVDSMGVPNVRALKLKSLKTYTSKRNCKVMKKISTKQNASQAENQSC